MENRWKQIFSTLKKSMASLSCGSNWSKCENFKGAAGIKYHVKCVAQWASKQVQAIKQKKSNQLREVNKNSHLVLATSELHVLEVHKTSQSKHMRPHNFPVQRASWNLNLQDEFAWVSKLLQHPGFPLSTWVLSQSQHGLLFLLILSRPAALK